MSGQSDYDDDTRATPKASGPAAPLTPDQIALRSQERRSQLLAIALGLETFLLVLAGVGVLLGYYQQQKARATEMAHRSTEVEHEAAVALNEARELNEQAKGLTEKPQQWQVTLNAAMAALKRAEALMQFGEVKDDLKQKVQSLRTELDQAQKACDLVKKLDDIRLSGDEAKAGAAANRYAQAFKDYGYDVRIKDPALTAKMFQALPNRDAVLDYVLDWASVAPDDVERRHLFAVVKAVDADANSTVRKIVTAFTTGDRKPLIELADKKQFDPLSYPPRTSCRLGNALFQLGAETEAIELLRNAQARYPQHFWLTYDLGLQLLHQKSPREKEEALRFLTAALALRNQGAPLFNNLGLAFRANGYTEEAIRAYEKALLVNANDVSVLNNLGIAQLSKGDFDRAIENFMTAKGIDPKRTATLINLGTAQQAKGDLDVAIATFKDAIEADPKSALAHTDLGRVLEAKGDVEGAIAAHQQALAIEPKSVEAHNNLGNAYLAKGDVEEALRTFRAALAIDQKSATTHLNLGVALRNQGDLDGAMRSFHTAIALDPKDPLPHQYLGFVQEMRGDFRGAIRSYSTALELNPTLAAAYISLGKARVEKGQLTEAIALLKQGVEEVAKVNKLHKQLPQMQQQLVEYIRWKGGKEGPEGREEGLDTQLRPVLIGEKRVGGADDDVAFARLCMNLKHMYVNAANFYVEAFQTRPELANDMRFGHRFDAACAAALAGTTQGEDTASLEETDRRIWREQARHWLEEDLAQWAKLAVSEKAADRVQTRAVLQRWKLERRLAAVRNKDALLKLPEAERSLWQKLWDDVDGVVASSNQKK